MLSAESIIRDHFPQLEERRTAFKIVCATARFTIREQDFQNFSQVYPHARGFDFGSDPAFSNVVDGMVMVDLHLLKERKRQRYMGGSFKPASCPTEISA